MCWIRKEVAAEPCDTIARLPAALGDGGNAFHGRWAQFDANREPGQPLPAQYSPGSGCYVPRPAQSSRMGDPFVMPFRFDLEG